MFAKFYTIRINIFVWNITRYNDIRDIVMGKLFSESREMDEREHTWIRLFLVWLDGEDRILPNETP